MFKSHIIKLLPKNILSRCIGKLSEIKFPSFILHKVIRFYCKFYPVRLEEAKKSISDFKTFEQFFTRQLKPNIRPIDPYSNSIVSPVDGTISEYGKIKDGLLIQAKDIFYSLKDLVGEKTRTIFENGSFITIYLSPADYHRIHSPFESKVEDFSYFSGNLWPVNRLGLEHVKGLFCLNERIVTTLQTQFGKIAVVKVGATIVGKISLKYHDITSNSGFKTMLNQPLSKEYLLKKGEELATFHLGSTVILLFQENAIEFSNFEKNQVIQLGKTIARVNHG